MGQQNTIRKTNQANTILQVKKPVVVKQINSVTDILQAKLKISQPDDRYEQEADRVADQLMKMPDNNQQVPTTISTDLQGSSAQRLLNNSEEQLQRQPEEEEEELIQLKSADDLQAEVNPHIEQSINGLRKGGQPLPDQARQFFESRFGTGFSSVRIHNSTHAARVAQSIRARAFTIGKHIAFASGEYAPDSLPGRRLLAHELTHVVQQNSHDRAFTGSPAKHISRANQSSAQRAPARGADPDERFHANQSLSTQISSIAELENDQQIQRDEDDAPAPAAPSLATPTLNFGTAGTTLTRGNSLTATVNFSANAGETLTVTGWRYTTPGHGTVTRSAPSQTAARAAFQASWSGTMAVSGELEMQYTITPAGGSASAAQTITEDITVNDRTGTDWQSSVTNAAEGALSGKSSPPRVFSDLGFHSATTSQARPTTSRISDGPNKGFTFVSSMPAGTYTSTPTIHPDLTATSSTFQTFHSDPSILLFVVGSTKTRIPNAEYSSLSTSGSLSFTVADWEVFYKAHNFYTVSATTTGGQSVPLQDAWWGLASNAENANISITNDAAVRTALGGSSGSYSGGYSVSAAPRGTWEGFELMQSAAILSGTRSHEYVHATHSHRANFTKMVRALDPRKVLEKKVSAPGHSFSFNSKVSTLIREILRPVHEIVDETASAAAETFKAQSGVTMAGVNQDPASGSNLGTVWNIHGDAPMRN